MITNVNDMSIAHIVNELRAVERQAPLDDEWCKAAAAIIEREVSALKNALLESPAAAEMMKQLPGAMRLRTKETDDLRAALFEACEIADENNTANASSDDRRKAFERITELRNLARK